MAREVAGAPAVPAAASSRGIYFGYWLIGAAFVAQFVSVGTQNYVVGSFLKPMTDDLGWSRSDFILARTISQFVMALVGLYVGTHVDRHGGRRLMLIGTVILASSLWALSMVQELWQWLVINGVIMTVGAAMIGNLVVNVTLSKWFVEKRGFAVSWASMGVSTAGVALTPAMTAVVDEWGWRAAWRVMAVGSAVLIIPAALMMRRSPEDYGLHPDGRSATDMAAGRGARAEAEYRNSLTRREALRTATFYLLVVGFGMFGVTIGVMLTQTIPFMTDAGYSRETAAFMITLASIPALASKPAWGYLMDRWDPKHLAALGAFLTGLALALITFSVSRGADYAAYSGYFLLGVGWGGMIPLQETIWASYFGRRHLGAVRSAGMPLSIIIGAGSNWLVPFYFDHVGNYNGAFFAVAVMNVISAAMLLFIPKPRSGLGRA